VGDEWLTGAYVNVMCLRLEVLKKRSIVNDVMRGSAVKNDGVDRDRPRGMRIVADHVVRHFVFGLIRIFVNFAGAARSRAGWYGLT